MAKAKESYKKARKKVIAASLREEGEAQASWGNKVRAPKVYDSKTALRQRAALKAAKAAKKKEQ